ncbi:MAG TPA: 2OG-Fe(II) oxygenase [Acidobacteriota bacterium]|nr:2OG-Fe(II) oxygenase [Acidobacteriota bacterium]
MAQPTMINFDAVRKTAVNSTPFPYLLTEHFLNKTKLESLQRDFPQITFPGSVPLDQAIFGPAFADLIEELEGPELRSVISEKFDINLDGRPTFITLRGMVRQRDGQIHTDTKSKLITLLLYFNSRWDSEGGRLRVLKNGQNLDDYVVELPPLLGTCLIFRVTDNCWHGHKPFEGERKAIQLNYLTDQIALRQHQSKHSFSAKLKTLQQKLLGRNRYSE